MRGNRWSCELKLGVFYWMDVIYDGLKIESVGYRELDDEKYMEGTAMIQDGMKPFHDIHLDL